ncbi:hypothetical protein GLOIN_2v1485492 [Rhizophagus irregularis DAOM 181602=DAOM 197198]|nr:hypothetical protein GLOIN_2v1485492 [Rhizophagus irregularis DAOM 181602=DAOM 197198]
MPQETQLDIEKTFESQKDLVVKTIVPNLMKTLDLDTYPIGEGVIYEMIYQRHRHKRDNLRVKNKSENDIKKETGRKHQNLRRSEKRKKRSKTINNLRNLNDPLIQKFSNEELRPIITENGYHSLEISESEDGQNIIVVCNLQWCSSTLRRFLYYVDSNTTKGDKKRERMYKPSEYVEETVPNSTPSWTKSGYDGPLKNPVIKAINHREKNLNDWQQSLLLKEQNLNEYQNNLNLFNKNMPLNKSDSIYAEWGIFKRSMNNDSRLGITSIGEVFVSNTFIELYNNWLNTDIGKNYKANKLIAVYVTKLDLSWTANNFRLVDNLNAKLAVCEKSGRHKIKFIIE